MSVAARARAWAVPPVWPAIMVALGLVVILDIVFVPAIVHEQTRDWVAYAQAAERLRAGLPLYVWSLATPAEEYYLYPPPAAAIWAMGLDAGSLLALKVVCLVLGMVALATATGPAGRAGVGAVVATIAAALLFPPNLHDLVLGNVMVFYVAGIAISLARPGWVGALALGLIVAIILKPVLGPYLVWLLIRRRADLARTAVVALAISGSFAVLIGLDHYVEYLLALPEMRAVAQGFSGNLGTVNLGPAAAAAGVTLAYGLTVIAAIRLPALPAAAVAIAMMLFAQPTIGFNYAGILLLGVALTFAMSRRVGLWVSVGAAAGLLVSPLLAAAVVAAGGFVIGRTQRNRP